MGSFMKPLSEKNSTFAINKEQTEFFLKKFERAINQLKTNIWSVESIKKQTHHLAKFYT